VDSYKTELIADRVWRSRAQLELATVRYVSWFNHDRLHQSLGESRQSSSTTTTPPRPTRLSRPKIRRLRTACGDPWFTAVRIDGSRMRTGEYDIRGPLVVDAMTVVANRGAQPAAGIEAGADAKHRPGERFGRRPMISGI
jgi:hypothetical protein